MSDNPVSSTAGLLELAAGRRASAQRSRLALERLARSVAVWRLALVAIVALGAGLRCIHLGSRSLWLDETFSLYYARLGPTDAVTRVLHADSHPPLYYLLLHFWTDAFGTGEFAVRALSTVLGVATILAVYAIGKLLVGRGVGIVAALLIAVTPLHVAESQEARNYALLALLAAVSYLLFLRLILGKRSLPTEAAYVLVTAAMLYTHLYGLFILAAQASYVGADLVLRAVRRGRWQRELAFWCLVQGAALALFLPWIVAIFGGQTWVKTVAGGTEILVRPSLRSLPATLRGDAGSAAVFAIIALAALGGYAAYRIRPMRRAAPSGARPEAQAQQAQPLGLPLAVLTTWLAVPVVLPFVVSYLVSPMFQFKYTIGSSVAFYLLAAIALCSLRPRFLVAVALALSIGLSAVNVRNVLAERWEPWRQVTHYVDAHAARSDLVVFDGPFVQIPFDHYSQRADLTRVPGAWTRDNRVQNDPASAVPVVRARRPERVWLVVSHSPQPNRIEQRLSKLYAERWSAEYVGIRLALLVRRPSS